MGDRLQGAGGALIFNRRSDRLSMMPIRAALSIFTLGAFFGCPGISTAQEKVVAYVPNWVDLKALSDAIDYPKLTHINIAFENPSNDAGDLSFNPQDEV